MDQTTGVITGMRQKGYDDVLCFNREQMKEMDITAREWSAWHNKRANDTISKGFLLPTKYHTSIAQSYEW